VWQFSVVGLDKVIEKKARLSVIIGDEDVMGNLRRNTCQ
jgi:hypothetical protein